MLILLKDELKYFIKSRFMAYLWIGLPLFSIIIHFFVLKSDSLMQMRNYFLIILNFVIWLISILTATSIFNDISQKFHTLLILRKVKRINILWSRFLSLFLVVFFAFILSFCLANIFGLLFFEIPFNLDILFDYLLLLSFAFFSLSVSCGVSLIIGLISNSMLTAILLTVFIVNNAFMLIMFLFENFEKWTNISSGLSKGMTFFTLGIISAYITIIIADRIFKRMNV